MRGTPKYQTFCCHGLLIPRPKTINESSLNCSDHKLTHPLINLPVALTLWLVSRIPLHGTLRHRFRHDIWLRCSRSISAAVDPLDNGLFVLTLDSQNYALSEIIPTLHLRNDCLTFVPKIPANCIVSACLFFLGSPKSNAHALCFAAV